MIPRSDERGMTLVELIVAVVVAALFLSLLTALFMNGLKAQAQTTARDQATGAVNLAGETIRASIRNAADFDVLDDGSVLIATVATGADAWECRGWALVDSELRYRSSTTSLDPASVPAWAPIVHGAVGTLDDDAAFAVAGGRDLDMGIRVTVGDSVIAITNGATRQAFDAGGFPTCTA